ncbi:MAG: DUF1569 domain-containing protein [Gemmatimonadales bacterium]
MARKSLADAAEVDGMIDRLARLTPETRRRWGTMTSAEALCHLGDAFETALGAISPKPMRVFGLRGPLVKWISLDLPLPWPHGIKGPPEIDPRRAGTKPDRFDADRGRVLLLLRRFVADVDDNRPHPMFGAMTRDDWLRWGWLHLDHHLRQFGC